MRNMVFFKTGISLSVLVLFSWCLPSAFATSVPTTTTLTVTSGSNPVTSVASGSQVTLTAAVTSGSTMVTVGQVDFCDASAPSCTDIDLLGAAQLTSAGTAVISLRPAVGTHSYKAVFAGTPHGGTAYAASTSSTATLTVTGLYPAFAVLTYTDPSPPGYNLSTIVGGNASTAPTGTVSFLDVNNSEVLATAPLSISYGPNFLNEDWPVFEWFALDSSGAEPIVVGDFNGDGSPDIAGAGGAGCSTSFCWDAAAGTVLNDGTGNLFPATTLDLGSSLQIVSVATGDFNGDGKLDLAVGGYASTYSITILLGNGDGTFTNKGSVATGGAFQAFAVGDFNGDGILDLAVANPTTDIVSILLGNGDGTFTASTAATSSTGDHPIALAVGDFNGDGIADLAVGNDPQAGGSGSLTILLGNGDGTFTAAASPTTASGVNSIALADFNGDGFEDIAVASGATLTLLKGNGDGTFATFPAPSLPPIPFRGLATIVGDFNGDGKADLAFAGYEFLLMGNGDGTFTTAPFTVTLPTSAGSTSFQIAAAADFNGDGATDLTGPASSEGPVESIGTILLAANQTAYATATEVLLPAGTGSQEVEANYPGDSIYTAASSGGSNLEVLLGYATVNLTASPNPAFGGSLVTFTATVAGSATTPTGTVIFYDGSVPLGSATLNSGGVATYATSTLYVGPHSLTAAYGGNGYYNASSSAAVAVTIAPSGTAVATVTVTPTATTITSAQTDSVTVSVAAATGSPTPTGTVTLSGGLYDTLQPLASGTASFTIPAGYLASGVNTLTAAYSGDATYAAASATATVTVAQVGMGIPAPAAVSAGASATATATFTASSSYSGTMNLTCALTKSPTGAAGLPTCSLNPASVTLKASGTATSVLTLSTTAPSSASLAVPSRKNLWGFGGGSAVLAVLFLCGIPARRRRFASMLALLCLVFASLAIGCGGGGSTPVNLGPAIPGTTSGSYIFTVTGTDSTSAATTTSATVTLTVQ